MEALRSLRLSTALRSENGFVSNPDEVRDFLGKGWERRDRHMGQYTFWKENEDTGKTLYIGFPKRGNEALFSVGIEPETSENPHIIMSKVTAIDLLPEFKILRYDHLAKQIVVQTRHASFYMNFNDEYDLPASLHAINEPATFMTVNFGEELKKPIPPTK